MNEVKGRLKIKNILICDIMAVDSITEYEKELLKPISLKLGGNELIFRDGQSWTLSISEVDVASKEIENLKQYLSTNNTEIEKLKQEIREINETKSVVLDMVSHNERTAVD